MPRGLRRLLGPALLFVLWIVLATSGVIDHRTFAPPADVWSAFTELLSSGRLQHHLWVSLQRVLLGLGIGITVGVVLALLAGFFRLGEDIIDGPMQIYRSLPVFALTPLVILWFGIGETPKVFLIGYAVTFPIYINTYAAIRSVDARLVESAGTFGLGRWQLARHVVLPGALPGFFTGLRFAFAVSWLVLVFAEQINATSGLGYLVTNAREFMRTDILVVSAVRVRRPRLPVRRPRPLPRKDRSSNGDPVSPGPDRHRAGPRGRQRCPRRRPAHRRARSSPAGSVAASASGWCSTASISSSSPASSSRSSDGAAPARARCSASSVVSTPSSPGPPTSPIAGRSCSRTHGCCPGSASPRTCGSAFATTPASGGPRQALAEVGLADHVGAWPRTLSGGEAQRVALARALVREPELLLLDEPFGALDALTRIKMHALLQDLCRRHRPSVLLVTHDVDEAILLADRVIVLDEGRVTVDVAIDLPAPRLRGSDAFGSLRTELLAALGIDERIEAIGRSVERSA